MIERIGFETRSYGTVTTNYKDGVFAGEHRGNDRHERGEFARVGVEDKDLSDAAGCTSGILEGTRSVDRSAEFGAEFLWSDNKGVALGQALLMPTDIVNEDWREGAGWVVDDGANPSAVFALAFKTFDNGALPSGGGATDEASEAGGEVCERFHAAKLRRDLPGKP